MSPRGFSMGGRNVSIRNLAGRCSHWVDLSYFDGAAVLQMGTVERTFHGFGVVGSLDGVGTAEDFLRLAVGSVGCERFAVLCANDVAGVRLQPRATCGIGPGPPGHILFGGLLHLL